MENNDKKAVGQLEDKNRQHDLMANHHHLKNDDVLQSILLDQLHIPQQTH